MVVNKPVPNLSAAPGGTAVNGEQRFWKRVGASWRHVAGGFQEAGFSFEWHEWDTVEPFDWAESFHDRSVEICLNLQGEAFVAGNGSRMDFAPETVGFIVAKGMPLKAQRAVNQRHQFVSVEFDIAFLRNQLSGHSASLHPLIRQCLNDEKNTAGVSGISPLSHRHRDLLRSLLRPPVLASAQRLWYEVKALEFATEFFFAVGESETLCTRAQRLATERVAKAKAILLENLAEPISLEELGRRVGCSHFYLSRTFTQETGLTISQWTRRARLEKAAELLRTGRCNVTEAALEVGYSSLSHFSEAFHEMYGCCPGLYPLRTLTQRQNRESS